MDTLVVAGLSFFGFLVAYHTYGRFLARSVFQLDDRNVVPSELLRDDVDFIPTRRSVIFGHHFTSIAGTGPIVGPAIAVFWGWLPAVLWVVLGSIFVGAAHDLAALVISLRNRGQTVGEVAGRLISPRARLLFLLVLFFALTVVLAIFGLVIAVIFRFYPESVLSVWVAMPIAILLGWLVYKRQIPLLWPSIGALVLLYVAVYLGVRHLPITLSVENPIMGWTAILMAYCFLASVLPVWLLLQPRDYVNSHQLLVALVLLVAGMTVAGFTGQANLAISAPAIAVDLPTNAPPIWPFLFITIACGACSGFHCLVSSGTSSKQVACETDAQFVAYGSMLLEGALAVIVILACCAGLGMGVTENDETLRGRDAWLARYDTSGEWNDFKLHDKVGAFVDGGANFVTTLGIPRDLAVGIIAVLVACFAATTLDTATRLQRYVIQEIGTTVGMRPLTNKFVATGMAVSLGLLVASIPASSGQKAGTGGLILWPLFGATNQLLAGLAFMVAVFYLWRRSKPVLLFAAPMLVMLVMPTWALTWQMFNSRNGWVHAEQPNFLLIGFGVVILALQAWMVVEAVLIWPKARGVLEDAIPSSAGVTG